MAEPTIAGRKSAAVRFSLDRSKLAELARAFHDDDSAWYGEATASAAGFDDVPVLPTVDVLVDHWRKNGAWRSRPSPAWT
ncbi:MAG TPA: MaoC family dehydratase N-terminal domain-containing protein [Solirubrobacteraceae bacterium]|nr:MaoC family dehydratase N-terminal domain-containing protein [Solirubrobacteraceae bacterium]